MGADLPLPPSSSFGRPSGARPTPTQTSVPPTNSFSRTLASPSQTSHRRSTPTLVSNVLSRPPSQKLIQGRHFNRRSHHSPTSLSLSPFLPLPVDQVEGKRERNRKWWKELRPEDDTRRGERDASSGILWKTCYCSQNNSIAHLFKRN